MTTEKSQPGQTRTIVKEIEIAAPIEAVWKTLTDPDELARWFPLEARVTPGAGGEIFLSWGPGCEGTARIDVWEPGRRLRVLEPAPGGGAEPVVIEWQLEARGGKTILRVVDSGFFSGAAWENEYFDSKDYGWTFMLLNLRHYLERHAGTPRQVAWPRRKVAVSREEAFARLVGAGGLFMGDPLANAHPGDALSLEAATGEQFAARLEFLVPPRGFCISIANLNDALLWLTIEGAPGQHDVQLWLSAYGLPQADVDAFNTRWAGVLEKVLPEAPPVRPQ